MLGLDIPYTVAQELAQVVDSMSGNKSTPLLNFAHIYLDKNQLLGVGSFSKVFRGKYRGKHCALKLIFTVDLTIETIRRVAAEAALLASVKVISIIFLYFIEVIDIIIIYYLRVRMLFIFLGSLFYHQGKF